MFPDTLDSPLLITDEVNQRWVHRLPMARGAILLTPKKNIFFSWGRFAPENLPRDLETRTIAQSELGSEVARILKEAGEQSLSVERDLPLNLYRQFEELGQIRLQVTEGLVEGWRETKDEWEIAQLMEASRITDLAFTKILDFLRPGVTELEVAAELEKYMRLEGSEEFNKTIVASGVNSAKPHHWPTRKPLEQGDFVTMDYGCTVNGYHSDLTRTVVLGRATKEQKAIYATVLTAQSAAKETLRAGLRSGELDGVARQIIDATEFQGTFLHNLGHGIGLDIHEGTGLVQGDQSILKPGMVVSIEPGIYVKDFGGVRIEDIAVIERDGCKALEHSDHSLIEI